MRPPRHAAAEAEPEERAETALLDRLVGLVRAGRTLARQARPDRRRALALVADLQPLLSTLADRRTAIADRLSERARARSAADAYRRTDRLAPSPRRDRTP